MNDLLLEGLCIEGPAACDIAHGQAFSVVCLQVPCQLAPEGTTGLRVPQLFLAREAAGECRDYYRVNSGLAQKHWMTYKPGHRHEAAESFSVSEPADVQHRRPNLPSEAVCRPTAPARELRNSMAQFFEQ